MEDIKTNTDLNERLRKTREPNSKLLVLEFMAPWSETCNFMKPTVEGMASSFSNADFCTLNVDKFQSLARALGVEALPVFLLVKGGRLVGHVVGVKGTELRSSIDQALK